jgi:hypothetical protein
MKCSKFSLIYLVCYCVFPTHQVHTLLHITRTAFLVRLATPAILPPTLARQQNGRGKLMALLQHFRFLGIALYGFLQYKLPLTLSHLFWKIRPIKWGSPDCSSHLGSGIIITVSNDELQPKQTYRALPIFEVIDYVDALLATLHGN